MPPSRASFKLTVLYVSQLQCGSVYGVDFLFASAYYILRDREKNETPNKSSKATKTYIETQHMYPEGNHQPNIYSYLVLCKLKSTNISEQTIYLRRHKQAKTIFVVRLHLNFRSQIIQKINNSRTKMRVLFDSYCGASGRFLSLVI